MKTANVTNHALERARERIGKRAKAIGIPESGFNRWLRAMASNALAESENPLSKNVRVTHETATMKRVTYGEFTLIFDRHHLVTIFIESKGGRPKGEALLQHIQRVKECP